MKSEQDHKLSKLQIMLICLGCVVVALLWLIQMDQWNAKEESPDLTVQPVEHTDA